MNRYIEAFLTLVLAVLPLASCGGNTTASSEKSITAYSFTSPPVVGIIDENAKTIAVIVPPGTNITALVATFATTGASVKVGATGQVSNATPNDFTNPVLYVVTAADGSTATYTVTVTIDPKAISIFSFTTPDATGKIDASTKEILVYVPSGTDLTSLVATFSTTGQSVMVGSTVQVSGVTPNNFTSPVTYTVTAADGSTQDYIVTVLAGALAAQWAHSVTAGDNTTNFNSVSVASDGSVYAVGYIYGTGTYNFGNGVTARGPSTSTNIVLLKYNSSGIAQRAQTMSAGSGAFNSVTVDSDGYVYAAGSSNGNSILVKYNSSGVTQWTQTSTTVTAYSRFNGVSVASDGSVYAAGELGAGSTYNFGNGVTATGAFAGGENIVLVKYNSSGVAQWARTTSAGSNYSGFRSVAAASDGSVYAVGYIWNSTYNVGNSVTVTGAFGGENIVIVKYDSSGVALWARTATGGNSISDYYSVTAASDGAVYTAGYIHGTGTYDFGNGITATAATTAYNIALVKYNSSGEAQWAQTVTAGHRGTYFTSVSVALDGSVYAAGYIHEDSIETGEYNFGNNVTVASTSPLCANLILVKYNSSGVAQRAQTVTAAGYDSTFNSVAVAADGSVYAAGYIYGTGTFNFGNNITATGSLSYNVLLVVKYY